MGKYEPLAAALQRRREDEWTASFAEVERVLGFSLPASARTYREWWANQRDGGHSQTKGWQDAGWRVWKVDLAGETVTFRRARQSGRVTPLAESDEALFEQASAFSGITDRRQLIREGMKALCEREAARHLMAMGGAAPNYEAPPRRRLES